MAISNGAGPYQFSDGNVDASKLVGGSVMLFSNGAGLYFLDTAIEAGVTTTTAVAGSLATTTNATGAGELFISAGGKWEYPDVGQ